MFWNILMIIVAAAAAVGGVRQSRIARGTGNKGMANLWMIIALFCGVIAVVELVALVANLLNP